MKFRAQWFAAAAVLLPIGVAVAEYAEQTVVPAAPKAVQEMLQDAEKVTRSIAGARKQLTRAAEVARKDGDELLLSCLLDKLQTVQKLEAMAGQSLGELQRSSDEANAQRPFVVVTVLGQKVTLTLQEAAACVDSKNTNGAVSIESIAPPEAPETDLDFGTDLGSDVPAVDDFDVLPPPTAPVGTETDFDPSTDMEPPIASPVR
jgi:hypothetical protein